MIYFCLQKKNLQSAMRREGNTKKTLNKAELIFVGKKSPFSYTIIIFLLVGGHEKKVILHTHFPIKQL